MNYALAERFKSKFIGDKDFYKKVLFLAVPIIMQSLVTNFVNLLDNIMVGQLGTAQMSGVSIANQLIFVVNLSLFGGMAGPGIFGAQFFGAKNIEGVRYTLRFKFWTALVIAGAAIIILNTQGGRLISLYLTGQGDIKDASSMLFYGSEYLKIILFGLLPFSLSQAYSSTLRETGETLLPLKAGITAVFVNLVLNYVLIFGKLGFPAMGVAGAAIATVISRYVECAIIILYTHRHSGRFPFVLGLYRSLKIPLNLSINILKKGIPLLLNEILWSLSVTTMTQIFSTCGLNIVAGLNISSTATNLFNVVFISIGAASAVMVGQTLGAKEIDRAKALVWKLIFFNVCACIIIGSVLAASAPLISKFYNTSGDVQELAKHFMRMSALFMPFHAITHICYFAIRSGGKTVVTFFFDSAYSWLICIPITYFLAHYSGLSILIIYPLSYIGDALKSILGIIIIRTGFWAQNFVSGNIEKYEAESVVNS